MNPLRQAGQNWQTTGLGLYAGAQSFPDGIRRVTEDAGDVVGWLQIVAAIIAVIVGSLSSDPGK